MDRRTTSCDVLIVLDVADGAVVEGTDGAEETDHQEEAQRQRDSNDRPGVQLHAAASQSSSSSSLFSSVERASVCA